MSDEHDEPTWFPRELRDDLSAEVATFGFFVGWFAPILIVPQLCNGLPGRPLSPTFITLLVVLSAAFQVAVWYCSTPYRMLGLTLPAAAALFVGFGWVHFSGRLDDLAVGLFWGGALNGLFASGPYLRPLPDSQQSEPKNMPANLRAVRTAYKWVVGGLAVVHILGLLVAAVGTGAGMPFRAAGIWQQAAGWYLFLFIALLCVWCWLRLFRPFFELGCQVVFWFLYSIRTAGPGLKAVPPFGPVLVIANHAAWFDPCFLGKILPRPITPMMTESFYKIWFLRPILKHVFRVIVVPEKSVRHDAPELRQAIEALGRGECVVLFPEGYLRRKEEVPLRRFGQGVWHILHACPDTPVICSWIEGSWGSKFSWKGGPPTKNKKMDFRLPIAIGVSEPEVVPADILADGLRTRIHLMNRVSAARAHLGLPLLPTFELPKVCEAGEESVPTDSVT